MKDNVIDNFMWQYQQEFQNSINSTAKELFYKIDPDLQPEVFLLGVLIDEQKDKNKICLEPEKCGYSVSDFSRLKQLAIEFEAVCDKQERLFFDMTYEELQIFHSNKDDNILKIKAYRKAIKNILNSKPTEKINDINRTVIYISYPNKVDNFWIFIILKLNKNCLNKHYKLVNNQEKVLNRFLISCSFIESLINIYLTECSKSLKSKCNNQSVDFIDRSTDELIREAGGNFMDTVAFAVKKGKNTIPSLYDTCNIISSLKYEGEEGLGKMVIAEKNHSNIKYTLQLKEPIEIQQFRKVRKFLQLAKEDSLIISDAALIYGLGEITGHYNPRDESLFIINFISHYKWEVLHANQSMMIVEYGQPRLPKELIDRDKFYSYLRRIFQGIEDTQISDLWDITIEATKQKHGTMLVITNEAKRESERLGKQCFPLTPLRLNTSIVQQITSIDGSVLIDCNAICYAIGVILDGNATDKGDASRGARYNSAIRYHEEKYDENNPIVLVIISEDGMINLIPKDEIS